MTNAREADHAHQRLAYALIFVTPALWCVNYLVARWAPGHVDPHTLAFGRWLIAAAVLGAVTAPELARHRAEILARWPRFLALGALGMLICGAWVYIAARTTSATNIALIYAASPVLIALASVVWLRERFSSWQSLGVVLALAGVVQVVIKGQWTALSSVQWVPGDAWIVAATAAWAAFSVLQRSWSNSLGAAAQLCAISLGGVIVLLPFVAWELSQPAHPHLGGYALWLMVLAALVPGVGAY